MASSQTQVVNLALSELGAALIISLDDDVKQAVHAKLHWQPVVESVARAYPWKCLKQSLTLASEAVTPVADWTYQFVLPPTCLRVLGASETPYEINKRRLLADADTITIQFIEYEPDVTQWDALFTQAVVARLAHVLAFPLTQSGSLKDSLWENYRKVVSEARTIDAQEGSGSVVEASDWVEARD